MRVSIITVCYNSVATLGDTLASVAAQDHPDVEHIVIDGGSTDGTQALVEREGRHVKVFVSEPDKGIYDAMNKGIRRATGDIVGFINADDFYPSSDVLSSVAGVFEDPGIEVCYGDLCYVRQDDTSRIVRYWQSSDFRPGLFLRGWCPPHPTFFARREVYARHGLFDLRYRIAADVEIMSRFLEVARVRARYLPKLLVKMRMGGTTNRSLGNIWRQNREIADALKSHGLPFSLPRFALSKVLSRGRQFVARPD